MANGDRYEGGRRCGTCGQTMRCTRVLDHYRGWMSLGTSYWHACRGCGLEIRTSSNWKAIVDLGSSISMAVVCLGMAVATLVTVVQSMMEGRPVPGMLWAMPLLAAAIGLVFTGLAVWSGRTVVNRFRHPLVA